jgi:malonyl CoA-acyl carrier protein transacylase
MGREAIAPSGAASRKFVLDSFTPVSYPRAMPLQANAAVMSARTFLVLARPATVPARARAGLSIGERIVLSTSAVSSFATLACVVGLVIIFW